MDREEEVVFEYLKSTYGENVIYEPDGNVPPDFVVNGLAIEVTRLNLNLVDPNKHKGYFGADEITPRIHNVIEGVVRNLNNKYLNTSESKYTILFNFNYQNPLTIDKNLKSKIQKTFINQLTLYKENKLLEGQISKREIICDNLSFGFFLSYSPLNTRFVHFTSVNNDLTTWEPGQDVFANNIELIMNRKSQKIKKYHSKYTKWQLILVDHINNRRSNPRNELIAHLKRKSIFSSIVVIRDPRFGEGFNPLFIQMD